MSTPPNPVEAGLRERKSLLWTNPERQHGPPATPAPEVSLRDIRAADARLTRLGPLLAAVFPELAASNGRIESALRPVPALQRALTLDPERVGTVWMKCDHELPVAGSVKARGGVYEVAAFAETLALEHGIISEASDRRDLAGSRARGFFERFTVSVGSTGNLGLSVGITAAALGFKSVVHMSVDAKQWKKDRLRSLGVEVVEHMTDYSSAVAQARQAAQGRADQYFVDDEQSRQLFLGYAVAALRLAGQLSERGVVVDATHPLFLYLPCGIGGAPGGIAFGAAQVFGACAHSFFAEPTSSPCMLLRLSDPETLSRSVYDIGLDNRTEADGLAVGRASEFVARVMRPLLAGAFTVEDDDLFRWLRMAHELEGQKLEPSATAGFAGPGLVTGSDTGVEYLERHGLAASMQDATHVLWATGGTLVPDEQFTRFLARPTPLRYPRRKPLS